MSSVAQDGDAVGFGERIGILNSICSRGELRLWARSEVGAIGTGDGVLEKGPAITFESGAGATLLIVATLDDFWSGWAFGSGRSILCPV